MAAAKTAFTEHTPAGASGMSDTTIDEVAASPSAEKNPDQWVTGNEAMTGAQASYLRTLAQEAGEELDGTLTKAEASKKIDELREQTGRGIDH